MKTNILLLFSVIAISNANASVSIKMTPNDVNVSKGQTFGARSGYEVKIYNDSDDVQSYEYHATLCPELNKCEKQDKNNIKIAPKDWFVDSFTLATTVRYNNPRSYTNKASVIVNGYEHTNQEKIAYFNVF